MPILYFRLSIAETVQIRIMCSLSIEKYHEYKKR